MINIEVDLKALLPCDGKVKDIYMSKELWRGPESIYRKEVVLALSGDKMSGSFEIRISSRQFLTKRRYTRVACKMESPIFIVMTDILQKHNFPWNVEFPPLNQTNVSLPTPFPLHYLPLLPTNFPFRVLLIVTKAIMRHQVHWQVQSQSQIQIQSRLHSQ
jgi:hypothetical protein